MTRSAIIFTMLLAFLVSVGTPSPAGARAVLPKQFFACDVDVDMSTATIHRPKGKPKLRSAALSTEIWCNGPITIFASPRVTRGLTTYIAGGKACSSIAFKKCRTFTAFTKNERAPVRLYTYTVSVLGVLPPKFVWRRTTFRYETPGFQRRDCKGYGTPTVHCVFEMSFWL